MIINLFSIFDPCTLIFKELRWVIILLRILFIPRKKYLLNNYHSKLFNKVITYLLNEFLVLLKRSPIVLLNIIIIFSLIFLNNVLGLFPYVFNTTRRLRIRLTLGLTIWTSAFILSVIFNYSNILVHLIPQGTPLALIPFIVLIELIRLLIRPITLAIRLTANIIAGHLLIRLVRRSIENENIFLFFSGSLGQFLLSILETAVAIIQAYVFLVLIILYRVDSLA